MRRLSFTEWLVLLVALASINLFLFKLHVFVGQVRARQVAYERSIDCSQHVDWYVAAEVLSEDERETATNACIYCTGPSSRACKYWLDRLS
jgi:hypothetical protein